MIGGPLDGARHHVDEGYVPLMGGSYQVVRVDVVHVDGHPDGEYRRFQTDDGIVAYRWFRRERGDILLREIVG